MAVDASAILAAAIRSSWLRPLPLGKWTTSVQYESGLLANTCVGVDWTEYIPYVKDNEAFRHSCL